jgi:hypothetical protein
LGSTGLFENGLETVLKSYVETALWSSSDGDGDGDDNLDKNYSIADISESTMNIMRRDVEKFLSENEKELKESGIDDERIGHYFWLSRSGHGAGFFDLMLDEPIERKLMSSSKEFGENDLYVGDDNKIYHERDFSDGGKPIGSTGLFENGGVSSTPPYERQIGFGKIDYDGRGRKINKTSLSVEIKIKDSAKDWETLEEVKGVPELTMSVSVWNSKMTDIVAGGQMVEKLLQFFPLDEKLKKLVSIWKEYHLNDLKAGTKKQSEALEAWSGKPDRYDYDASVEYLKSINLYDDRGYKYGNGWLYMPIPESVIKETIELANSYPEFEKFEDGGTPGADNGMESFEKSDVPYRSLPDPSYSKGGVAKIPNIEASSHSEHRIPFKGSNLEGKELDNGDYLVLSHGHYPIWWYSGKDQKWYGNSDKYSVSASKQTTQSRPTWDATMLSHADMLNKMKESEAHFDLGGIMVKSLMPMPC